MVHVGLKKGEFEQKNYIHTVTQEDTQFIVDDYIK